MDGEIKMKKKVLFVIWTLSGGGGAEKILSNIVNNMDYREYDISILEFINLGGKEEKINKNIKILKPIIIKKKNIFNKIYSKLIHFLVIYNVNLLRKIFIKENYDVEIAFNYQIPGFIVAESSAKKIMWVHGSIENLYNIENREVKLQRRAFNVANEIVAISEKTEKSICEFLQKKPDNIKRIYNGYEFSEIIEKSKEKIELERKNKKIIMAVGRMDTQKNFILLVDVAIELKKRKENYIIYIIGEGEQRARIEEKIKKNGLEEYIKLLGYKDNPYPYMKIADVYCLTSKAEGFPTVLIETMVLGCPFIATDVAGTRELYENEKCGVIVQYEAKEICDAILKISKNEKLRNEMSENCKKKAKKYSIENQIKKIEKIILN